MDYNWDTLLCPLRATLLLVHFKWRGPLTALWESSLAWPSPLSSDQPSRHWPHSQTLVCGQWLPSPVCLATHTKGRERKQAKANQTLCISSQLHSLTIRRKESQDLIKLVILIQNHSNVSENNLEPAVLKQGTHSTPVHSVCVRYVSPHLQTSAALTCSQKRKLIQIKEKTFYCYQAATAFTENLSKWNSHCFANGIYFPWRRDFSSIMAVVERGFRDSARFLI